MNHNIVVDASVAVKWLRSTEEDAQHARKILKDHLTNTIHIIVPSFLFLEVANAIATKIPTNRNDIDTGLSLLYNAQLEIIDVTKGIIIEASTQARAHHTSVYDMLYAVIAKQEKATLITADARFLAKTKLPFVQLLDTFLR